MRGKHKTFAIVIGVLLATQAAYWPWSRWVTSPLLDLPVRLDREVHVARSLRVPIAEPYQLSLMFPRHAPQGDLRDLLDQPQPCTLASGTIQLPLRWSLMTPSGETAASGDGLRALCAGSWSSDHVWMPLAEVRVPTGRYDFHASLGPWPASASALAATTPRLLLAMHGGKAWSSWQLNAVFWGGLASVYLVWPLLALLVLGWLWRAVFPRR